MVIFSYLSSDAVYINPKHLLDFPCTYLTIIHRNQLPTDH